MHSTAVSKEGLGAWKERGDRGEEGEGEEGSLGITNEPRGGGAMGGILDLKAHSALKGLSHEKVFKNFDKNLQNLASLRDAAGF
jgi:hypothetical protein